MSNNILDIIYFNPIIISTDSIENYPLAMTSPPPTNTKVFLGSEMEIYGSNVNFNNANVFVKLPTEPTHLANKEYTDTLDADARELIQNAKNETTVNYNAMSQQISVLQERKQELITQFYNLRNYFFRI